MAKYDLKPGIVHIKDKCISPFTNLNTVYMNNNTKLAPYLEELYRKYKERNKPTYETIDFSIDKTDWVFSDGIYKYNLGKVNKEDYRLYDISTLLNLNTVSTISLMNDPMYRFIKVDIDEGNIIIYSNILPNNQIKGSIMLSYVYDVEIDKGTPKNLEVKLLKEQFIKVDDMLCMYKINLPELDLSLNYNISYTFNLNNIQNFLASNNKFISIDYSYGEAIIYTQFPFTAEILLIISIKE